MSSAPTTPGHTPTSARSVRSLLRACVRELAEPFHREEVFSWFEREAPGVDRLAVDGLLSVATVNDRRRRHFPQPEDLLFWRPDGRYERFGAAAHGSWSPLGEYRGPGRSAGSLTGVTRIPARPPAFEDRARVALSERMGVRLLPSELVLGSGVAVAFDLVSDDRTFVGRIVWVSASTPGWSRIGESVWLLQQVHGADRRLLVLGGDEGAIRGWVDRMGPLAPGIELFVLSPTGGFELRRPGSLSRRRAV